MLTVVEPHADTYKFTSITNNIGNKIGVGYANAVNKLNEVCHLWLDWLEINATYDNGM